MDQCSHSYNHKTSAEIHREPPVVGRLVGVAKGIFQQTESSQFTLQEGNVIELLGTYILANILTALCDEYVYVCTSVCVYVCV